ncbi:hypothetical protein [Acidocella sp.]|uniref:hypothetical protein n=1 Tax=Acidocella sp. TaxID=50710 RepID=UPI0026057758|nr:hypothetical protein [Acidocella sp.]
MLRSLREALDEAEADLVEAEHALEKERLAVASMQKSANALEAPILEAAAKILAPRLASDGDIEVMRRRLSRGAFQSDLDQARAMIEEAARQIDHLRAIGAIPGATR